MHPDGEDFGISPLNGFTADMAQTHATFVCADVVRFTSMTQRLGDCASLRLMRRVARLVQSEAEVRGGRVVEIRGDSFLLVLPRPDQAVGCAEAIHESLGRDARREPDGGVQVRIAVHAGPVLQMRDHFFGLNLILPYRLLPLLEAGETAVTEAIACVPGVRRICRPKGFRDSVVFSVLEHATILTEPSDSNSTVTTPEATGAVAAPLGPGRAGHRKTRTLGRTGLADHGEGCAQPASRGRRAD